MTEAEAPPRRAEPEPLPTNISSIQPGGGNCYQVELAWGRWRRWYLRTFRSGYVQRMAARRQGSSVGAPHDLLDPRDLKYCRNQCTAHWEPCDDPFAWREQLPFARWGLAELQLMGWPWVALMVAAYVWGTWYWALVPALPLLLVLNFFRDPPRRVPQEAGLVVAPADGKVVEITPLEDHPFIGGPAVRIGIFLSIFNVHINRAPLRCRVLRLHYSPGRFMNALDPESALLNENMWMGCEEDAPPYRRFVVRQIAGALARRIVCDVRMGEVLERGRKFGMIKLGSRTELILAADEALKIEVQPGQHIQAGRTIVARYEVPAD